MFLGLICGALYLFCWLLVGRGFAISVFVSWADVAIFVAVGVLGWL